MIKIRKLPLYHTFILVYSSYSKFLPIYTKPNSKFSTKLSYYLLYRLEGIYYNVFVYILDYWEDMRINWAYWTTFGWGIGLVSHAFRIFCSTGLTNFVYKKLK